MNSSPSCSPDSTGTRLGTARKRKRRRGSRHSAAAPYPPSRFILVSPSVLAGNTTHQTKKRKKATKGNHGANKFPLAVSYPLDSVVVGK